MFTTTDCKKFAQRFYALTNQNVEDWTSYEQVVAEKKELCPLAVGKAIDQAISGEIAIKVGDGDFQATYIRDLAALLVELRSAMM